MESYCFEPRKKYKNPGLKTLDRAAAEKRVREFLIEVGKELSAQGLAIGEAHRAKFGHTSPRTCFEPNLFDVTH
jgi:hypothetical protein